MIFKPTPTNWLLLLVASAMISASLKITGINISYSEGERSGVVVKLSRKGVIWKTWEGQMNLGAIHVSTDRSDTHAGAVPVTWEFSVSDEFLVKQILYASRNGTRITLKYREPFVMSWRNGASDYIVTGIETQDSEPIE